MSIRNIQVSQQDRIPNAERQPVPRSVLVTHPPSYHLPFDKLHYERMNSPSYADYMDVTTKATNTLNRKGSVHVDPKQNIWKVEQAREMGPLFSIERSHEAIDHLSPSEIASNVHRFLVSKSIDATYDDEEAVAYVQTNSGCRFRVYLKRQNHNFKGVAGKEGSVLVEVQRRSGCSVEFHSLATQILYAAKGSKCPFQYAIDTHKDLKCVTNYDLFGGAKAARSAHVNLIQGV